MQRQTRTHIRVAPAHNFSFCQLFQVHDKVLKISEAYASCVWWRISLRTQFESGRSLFLPTGSLIIVRGCMVMDWRPWAHLFPAIMSPSERWMQGDYDFRLLGASWLMVWWVGFSPCCDFTGSVSHCSSALLDPFSNTLKKGKERSESFLLASEPGLSVSASVAKSNSW